MICPLNYMFSRNVVFTVSEKILTRYAAIACPLGERKIIQIFCSSIEALQQVLDSELSKAIALEFPLIEKLIFYVEGAEWARVPTQEFR